MNYPSAIGYSIWLEFDIQSTSLIRQIIEDLRSKFKSPLFDPHLTLLPGIEDDENELISNFSHFVMDLNSFPIEIESFDHSDEFYKCVFMKVKKSNVLMDLYSKSKLFLKKGGDKVFNPHISLIYAYLSVDERAKIVEDLRVYNFNLVEVKKISLVKTIGEPSDWKHLTSFNLI